MKRYLKFFRKYRRYVIVAGILLIGVGIWLWRQSQPISDIKTVKVARRTIAQVVSSSGKTKSIEEVTLHFQTPGRLSWIAVMEGDRVWAGQIVASLDTHELQKNLEKALRDYLITRNDFEEDRLVTYDLPVKTDTIKRILEKNQWNLEKAVLDVELKDIALKFATLVSPISGIVTNIDTLVAGVNVTIADSINISNMDKIIFLANVDETEIGQITLGMQAQINLDAFPDKTFTGSVGKIAFAAEQTSAGATVFPVEIYLTEPTGLRIGLNGDVSIGVRESQNTFSIPLEAVREEDDLQFVYVKEGETYRKQPVKTGIQTEDDVEILEGLSQNQEVVTAGFQRLPQ